ncbi:MAG TPA: ArsR family transcriptional regulator [Solirubrobacterales bacterium]|nr:ArsR family transcriptional regulator [Solirubrobacterales bacterium]
MEDRHPSSRREAPERLPSDVVELTAARLRVLGKAKSIALLDALRGGEATVQDLADEVGLAHQNTSHHLAALWREGIVSRRAEGPSTLYALEDWGAWWVVEQIAGLMASPGEQD